jgi:acyl carrier protein
VRADDDFFELGGHSLMGAQLVARLEDRFDVEIDLLTIFDHPTAAGIARVVGDELRVEDAPPAAQDATP